MGLNYEGGAHFALLGAAGHTKTQTQTEPAKRPFE